MRFCFWLLRITITTDFCIADSLQTHCGVFTSAHLHTGFTQWGVKFQLYLCAPCSCQNPEAIDDTVLPFYNFHQSSRVFPNQNYSVSLWNGSVSSCWAALKTSTRVCVSIHYHISYHCLLMTRKPSQCPPIHIIPSERIYSLTWTVQWQLIIMMARSLTICAYSDGAILFKTHAPDPNLYVQTAGFHTVITITISAVLPTLIMTFTLSQVQILQSTITVTTNASIAASVFPSYALSTAAESDYQLWFMLLYYSWLITIIHCDFDYFKV